MFGTGHPQPPHRKEVAMQIVQRQQRDFDAHRLYVDPPGGDVAPPPAMQAVTFDVAYTLREYLSIVRDHLAFTWRRLPRSARLRQVLVPAAIALLALPAAWLATPGAHRTACLAAGTLALGFLPFTMHAWVALVGTPVFFLKKRRMPVCAFRIDDMGVERTTRAGTWTRPWAAIDGVRHYRTGYLLMTGKGGVPIPYRCLDGHQTVALLHFARQRRAH